MPISIRPSEIADAIALLPKKYAILSDGIFLERATRLARTMLRIADTHTGTVTAHRAVTIAGAIALSSLCPLAKKITPSFRMVYFFGAGDEARTRYLDLGKVALYQMSYARKRKYYYRAYSFFCQEKNAKKASLFLRHLLRCI